MIEKLRAAASLLARMPKGCNYIGHSILFQIEICKRTVFVLGG